MSAVHVEPRKCARDFPRARRLQRKKSLLARYPERWEESMTRGAMMRRGVFLLIAVAVSLASCIHSLTALRLWLIRWRITEGGL